MSQVPIGSSTSQSLPKRNLDPIRSAIVAEVRSLIGVPFLHKGRTRNGIDCVGVIKAAIEAGLGPQPDFDDYPLVPASVAVFAALSDRADRVLKENALPGDIVVMTVDGKSAHVGIQTDRGVVHATRITKRVTEDRYGFPVAFYRFRGVPACP